MIAYYQPWVCPQCRGATCWHMPPTHQPRVGTETVAARAWTVPVRPDPLEPPVTNAELRAYLLSRADDYSGLWYRFQAADFLEGKLRVAQNARSRSTINRAPAPRKPRPQRCARKRWRRRK